MDDGRLLGMKDGTFEGSNDGKLLGTLEGIDDGRLLGSNDGVLDGTSDGRLMKLHVLYDQRSSMDFPKVPLLLTFAESTEGPPSPQISSLISPLSLTRFSKASTDILNRSEVMGYQWFSSSIVIVSL